MPDHWSPAGAGWLLCSDSLRLDAATLLHCTYDETVAQVIRRALREYVKNAQ